jgi:hypothetical protein
MRANVGGIISDAEIVNLVIMTPKKSQAVKAKLPKGFTIDPTLEGKYDDQPLFQDKVDRANQILKTVGLPKFVQPK